ncbi:MULTISPECIES: transposase [unclassified Vibrio]
MDFLGDYNGYLQTDGYTAYHGLHHVTNVGCLTQVHGREEASRGR